MQVTRARFAAVAALVLTAASGACESKDIVTTPTTPTTTTSANDAQLVAVLTASNRAELTTNQQATNRASSQAVKAFAQTMVTQYTTAQQQLQALNLTSDTTAALFATLTASARQTQQLLAGFSGATYDRMFLQTQVTMLQNALTLYDQVLIAQAGNTALKNLLVAQRGTVALQLQLAQDLSKSLG